jgi:hypothetical protein
VRSRGGGRRVCGVGGVRGRGDAGGRDGVRALPFHVGGALLRDTRIKKAGFERGRRGGKERERQRERERGARVKHADE